MFCDNVYESRHNIITVIQENLVRVFKYTHCAESFRELNDQDHTLSSLTPSVNSSTQILTHLQWGNKKRYYDQGSQRVV